MRIQERSATVTATNASEATTSAAPVDDGDIVAIVQNPAIEAQRGAKGEAEDALRTLLIDAGAPAADLAKDKGHFGPATETWLKQFQLAVGLLPADGKVSEATVARLVALSEQRQPVFVTQDAEGHRVTYGGMLAHFPNGSSPDGFSPRNQNNNPRVPLGDQDGLKSNLQDQGCTVTCLAMVATKVLGLDVTPAQINDDKDNFSRGSANLNLSRAVDRLGLSSTAIEMHDPGAVGELLKAIDAHDPVIMRVDFRGDSRGDHSVVITGRSGQTLRGIDPATGGPVEMRIEADGEIRGEGWRHYQATGFRIVTTQDDHADFGELP